jgi:hypothetical protein
MIVYRAVPYLVVLAPPAIVLLSVLMGCTISRPPNELADRARFHSGPDSRAGAKLVMELDRRAARQDLRRIIGETQR